MMLYEDMDQRRENVKFIFTLLMNQPKSIGGIL